MPAIHKINVAAGIHWVDIPEAGLHMPWGLPESPPALGPPLAFQREREDRLTVSAGPNSPPGWAYVAHPSYPGWRVTLESRAGIKEVVPLAALGAFQRVPVPPGPWRLHFRYEPWTFSWGAALSVVALLALTLYWYNCIQSALPLPDAQ
jgi:hypothetical protein